ncbi:hypothetical protein NUU61_002856 [Penicillium alfredii]|uniref:BZIP domain-containing protein n=1 Tax=Penicillium alfredii TaxID=1506179 RepID=A0A9W9KGB3_9EURO|nr:uncharacterized protein NUU61_002856 [Penicillium alfredii]KAJ5105509.1 hypothetical protein NUU61_002856 [Penicillium alfredii]
MPASEGPRSDQTLSDMLSARSYFETPREGSQKDDEETVLRAREPQSRESNAEIEGNRRLRPRKRPPPGDPKTPEQAPESKTPDSPDRPVRKRGRPKLDTAKDATALEERRLQIRRAQRTYRLKKETTIQTLKTRVAVLEHTLQNVSDLLDVAHQDGGNTTRIAPDYMARTRELVLAEIDKTRHPREHNQIERAGGGLDDDDDVFGYHVLQAANSADTKHTHVYYHHHHNNPQKHPAFLRARSPSPLINRLLPTSTIYTYSHQERDLSHRLHRFSLEHIYRWLTDPGSDPALLSRVFGLFPCIHDMPGVKRSLRRVLQSEIGSALEMAKLPFYTLGGAGTHFPRRDQDGQPVYPDNMRRPGKILRRLARILCRGGIQDWDEDWSGDKEPWCGEEKGKRVSEEDRLRSLDLDGDWFDCHDVQGYLEHRGIVLDGSSLRLEVPAATVGALYGFSLDRAVSFPYSSPEEISPDDSIKEQSSTPSTHVLDVECFFNLLLVNLRILGRAPGFRLWDVDAALRGAIHRRPFG